MSSARRGVRVVLDTEGEPLRHGLEAEPFLVSPNQREAEGIVGQELEDDEDFVMALDALADLGARNVLLTLENGAFARVREERRVRRYRAFAPQLEPVSTVGTGDVLLAQWLAARLDERGAEDALRFAVAAGAASCLEVGAGRFDPREAARLAGSVEVARARAGQAAVADRPAGLSAECAYPAGALAAALGALVHFAAPRAALATALLDELLEALQVALHAA